MANNNAAGVSNALSSVQYIFENEITDRNIQRYIFGSKGYSVKAIWNTKSYPIYFNNVLSLAFYFVYACYRCDMDYGYGDMENLTSHNAKRIKNSLSNALVRFPITTELIQFVLTDIQFELALGESSKLKNMFNKLSSQAATGFDFNPYFSLIAEYNQAPARFLCDQEEMWTMFSDLLNTLTFLKDYQLIQNGPDSFQFLTHRCANMLARGIMPDSREHYNDMPLEHLLFLDDTKYFGGIYRLFSIDIGEKSEVDKQELLINLRYFTPSNDRSLLFSLPEEGSKADSHLCGQRVDEVFQEAVGVDFIQDQDQRSAKKNNVSIDQIHAVNYRHIKNLALAISDALSSNKDIKSFLYRQFHKEYPEIFIRRNVEAETDPSSDLDWDSVVIMLLIESSPKVVLEHIIRKSEQMFYNICTNLYTRSYDKEKLSLFAVGQDALKDVVHQLIQDRFILGEAGGFGKLPTEKTYSKLFPRAATMLILSKLNDLQEDDSEESLIYTGNLRHNISLLQRASTEFDMEKGLKYACIILGETIKHTISFYEGLFAYGKAKSKLDERTARTLSKKALLDLQKKLEKEFLRTAKERAEVLPAEAATEPAAALNLLNIFISFCESCTLQDSRIKENSKFLYAAVGKYEIVDLRRFKAMAARLYDNKADTRTAVKAWVDTTLEILEFFETGSWRDTTMDSDLFNAVYPFTAVFNRRKENQDGYKTVNFSLNIDSDEDAPSIQPLDINVLSEFVYDRSEVYYCVPNVLRSNYKWWIDPILISFRDFNDIFSDIRKDDE